MASAEKRVLVVDDEEFIRYFFSETLSALPVEVTTAETAEAAEAALARTTYDLVVSDFSMPGKSGIDLLGHVRETYPGLKFGIVTGSSGQDSLAEIRAEGPDFLLEKPVDVEEFLDIVRRALGL
jgi:DNA-binding NtrC family response regulator